MSEPIVLIVDDDRTIVRLCQRLLERASFKTVTAMDPIEALKILERQKVDLLLSDIRMPVMDGFELISQAKQFQPDLPVLVMTGYGSIDYAIQALHRGVDGLILKPFENTAELVQAVQRVLEENRQRRDAARLQALRPLFDVTERLLAETSPQPLEKLILGALTGLFQAGFAGIYRLGVESAYLEMVRTSGKATIGEDFDRQQMLIELAIADGSPAVFNATGPTNSQAVQEMLCEAGLESMLIAPVRRNNSQFVFCSCREKSSAPFAEADLEMFVILARQAAVAMENARLYSELRDYVRRVEDSQRALIQAEKMAAVGRLMASLAHEINNPLQAVRNCLHLAAHKGIDTEQRLRYIDMTDNELERLVTTVRRMLDFYRPGGAEKEPTDIHHVIDQVMALLTPKLSEQNIRVHIQSVGVNSPVNMVADQIQQVIFNLLINAIDALEEAGPVYRGEMPASGMPSARAAELWVDVYHEDHQVRVVIEDSGPGIAPELQEQIFEPFVSTKQHGTGLGLAVSYGIMERHQGNLSVIPPRYGEGACFEIVLPLDTEGENGKNTNR